VIHQVNPKNTASELKPDSIDHTPLTRRSALKRTRYQSLSRR